MLPWVSPYVEDRDLLCLSALRWNFVCQRPQHLMTRFATRRRVYFLEEPVFGTAFPILSASRSGSVRVLTPQLPRGVGGADAAMLVRQLVRGFLRQHGVVKPVQWFYTPAMLPIVEDVPAAAVVYDGMDELSASPGAAFGAPLGEPALLALADVVFTDAYSLFERKRQSHPHVHAFPSSIDATHFAQARRRGEEPEDQRHLSRPRIGFSGIVDERLDLELIEAVARMRPDWQLVMIGPTAANVDPATLPRAANIHYLGMKSYDDLPRYFAGWDVAMLPLARNESTRHLSPTKTPEYLAAGRPVVSTSVRDVVRPYGERRLVRIADVPEAFVAAIGESLFDRTPPAATDAFLAGLSWDRTWASMNRLLEAAIARREPRATRPTPPRIDSKHPEPINTLHS
jgi:glycosyltransferase involved in cell wall biosynthesis